MGFARLPRDITGLKFNRLLAIEETPHRSANHIVWKFLCDCGNFHLAPATEVKLGRTKSCGCLLTEFLKTTKTTHGATRGRKYTPAYASWISMKQRCDLPTHKSFAYYGGRGIAICARWREFENFLSDMGEPPLGHSLDRIDYNGHYEPSNCRWATQEQQQKNRSSNRNLEAFGKVQCITEWAKQFGISVSAIQKRLARGIPIEKAVSAPPTPRHLRTKGII